jgi:HMG (high mobility group) box
MAKQDSTPEVSKDLGLMWRNMPPSQKQHWINQADAAKVMHKIIHPEYKFKPVHRRDEFGNYIRKPRRPNRPRVKKDPRYDDTVEHLSGTYHSLEGKPDVDFLNAVLPSDASSVSSPPPSPSPVPSLPIPSSSSSRLFQRRSSSVPLTGPDDSFFGTASSSVPFYPSGLPTSQLSRRYSKRPSTSMDFMCAGLAHSQPYMFSNNTEPQYAVDDNSLWRTGHRRSISAPDFSGDIASNLIYSTQNGLQEANPLTPINPVFGSMFERFSWNTVCSSF